MFELQITDTDVTTGTIPVSWCLDKETLMEIEERVGPNPQVVIVVAPTEKYHISKEHRQVVPLRDLMTYVNFRSSGHNRIWAFISSIDATSTRCQYLAKDYDGWAVSIVNADGNGWGYRFRQTATNGDKVEQWFDPQWGSFVDVNVPAGVFAPEPSAREKAWVNYFFHNKAVDQCNFRRRKMFAYTVQPILIALQMVVRLFITLVALLCGTRNFSLQPLLHPLTHDMNNQFSILGGGSIFIRKLPDDEIEYNYPHQSMWWLMRKIALLPLMPAVFIFIIFSIFINPEPLLIILLLTVGFIVMTVLISLGVYLFKNDGWIQFVYWIENKMSKTSAQISEEESQLLVCSPNRKPVTMSNLPAKKKTIRLRFLDLKSRVCKPFSA